MPGDAEQRAEDIFRGLGQDFAALLGRLNAENIKGRGELAADLRAEIEQSRVANVEGREKLATDLRVEIEQSRTAEANDRKALRKSLKATVHDEVARAENRMNRQFIVVLVGLLLTALAALFAPGRGGAQESPFAPDAAEARVDEEPGSFCWAEIADRPGGYVWNPVLATQLRQRPDPADVPVG